MWNTLTFALAASSVLKPAGRVTVTMKCVYVCGLQVFFCLRVCVSLMGGNRTGSISCLCVANGAKRLVSIFFFFFYHYVHHIPFFFTKMSSSSGSQVFLL